MWTKNAAYLAILALTLGATLGDAQPLNKKAAPAESKGPKSSKEPFVSTANGTFVGKHCVVKGGPKRAAAAFLGIRYAKPPTGNRRFKPPQDIGSGYETFWSNVSEKATKGKGGMSATGSTSLNATQFGPICPQSPIFGYPISGKQSEDCLFLNVYAPPDAKLQRTSKPSKSRSGLLPVRVWIHGGGYVVGAGSDAFYDGCPAVANGGESIIVTLNYRLGALGFLAHPSLNDPEYGNGNWGLRDALQAIKWVKNNIEAFGGDPEKITIFGESAGGSAVFALSAATGGEGLWNGAIAESGTWSELQNLNDAYNASRALVKKLGCSDGQAFSCLRNLTYTNFTVEINTLSNKDASYLPIVDGVFLKDQITKILAEGKANGGGKGNLTLNFLAGVTQNESAGMLYVLNKNSSKLDEAGFVKVATENLGVPGFDNPKLKNWIDQAKTQYAASKYNNSWFDAASALLTDFQFRCPTRRMLDAITTGCESGNVGGKKNGTGQSSTSSSSGHATNCAVYAYEFTRAGGCNFFGGPDHGATHGAEIAYVFGTEKVAMCSKWTRGDRELASNMRDAWDNLAASGAPDIRRTALSTWPKWNTTAPEHGQLDVKLAVVKNDWAGRCELSDTFAKWLIETVFPTKNDTSSSDRRKATA